MSVRPFVGKHQFPYNKNGGGGARPKTVIKAPNYIYIICIYYGMKWNLEDFVCMQFVGMKSIYVVYYSLEDDSSVKKVNVLIYTIYYI